MMQQQYREAGKHKQYLQNSPIGWQAYRGDQIYRKKALHNPEVKSK